MILKIQAFDTLFFRDGSPFNAGESVMLTSMFPPASPTAYGLVRAALVEVYCKEIKRYVYRGCRDCPHHGTCTLRSVVGDPSQRDGTLVVRGPFVTVDGTTYYPAPVDLTCDAGNAGDKVYPGSVTTDTIASDLGDMRLPTPGTGRVYAKTHDTHLLSSRGLQEYLAGRAVQQDDLIPIEMSNTESKGSVVARETRTGIAVDPRSWTSLEKHLYWLQVVRPMENVTLTVWVDGTSVNGQEHTIPEEGVLLRFGGEGHMVNIMPDRETRQLVPEPCTGGATTKDGRFRLVLLQDADFDGSWRPPELERHATEETGTITYRGRLRGLDVELVSAAVGRARYVGGWDTARRRPRDVAPLVPAGSVYYFESDAPFETVVERLHNSSVGNNTNTGLGHCVVGVW